MKVWASDLQVTSKNILVTQMMGQEEPGNLEKVPVEEDRSLSKWNKKKKDKASVARKELLKVISYF